ncbi:hypothetical protein CUMW_142600, partial [Citrus unshiu]
MNNNNEDIPEPVCEQKPSKFFGIEMHWMPAEGYAESNKESLRKIAMHQILQISKSNNLDAMIPYAAMNIFDRFISRNEVPRMLGGMREDIVLAADACLTISWSVKSTSFSYDEFLEADNHEYKDTDARVVRKVQLVAMEQKIDVGVDWRMRVATPISFVEFFVGIIPIGRGIKRRTLNEIVIQTQGVIAASAVFTACRVLFNDQYYREKENMIRRVTKYVDEEDLEACLEDTCKMCIEKQIMLERDLESADWKKLEEEINRRLETSSSSSSFNSISNRDEEDDPQGKIDPDMNFELKWMMLSSEDPEERTINFPDIRTLATDLDDPSDDNRAGATTSFRELRRSRGVLTRDLQILLRTNWSYRGVALDCSYNNKHSTQRKMDHQGVT